MTAAAHSPSVPLLSTSDTDLITAGGATPARSLWAAADDSSNVAHVAALDIPILQGLRLTSSRNQ